MENKPTRYKMEYPTSGISFEILIQGLPDEKKTELNILCDEFVGRAYAKIKEDKTVIEVKKFEMLNCFPLLLVKDYKEVPNEYDTYPINSPWLLVETEKGCVKIGKRKRVWTIEWDRRFINKSGADLTEDDVTKWENGIHAWTLEKAKEYILSLLS